MRLSLSYDGESQEIKGHLDMLERRLYVARAMIPQGYESYFQESARYTSVHTSTAIEGNPLGQEEAMLVLVEGANPESPPEVEKVNLDDAYELMSLLAGDRATKIDEGTIRTFHSLILKGLPDSAAKNRGRYRIGPSLVVDASTRGIRYRPPAPQWIPELMQGLILDANEWLENEPGALVAALVHFGLISIHPFDDGNGRTARLIADMVLNLTGWSADGMLSASNVLHARLPEYYRALREAQGEEFREEVDVTPFLEFHTTALASAAVMLEEKAVNFNRMRDDFIRNVDGALSPRRVTGLMFMIDIGPISSSHYARLTNSSQATALSDLSFLVERGLATREGGGKSTRYRLGPKLQETIQRVRAKGDEAL